MKTAWMSGRIPVLVLILLLAAVSCRKDDEQRSNSYLVSKDLVFVFKTTNINTLIDVATALAPGAADMKPLVETDVNVYKVVYNSVINGKETKLSGLVCVPAKPGDYPVLSFQNGTNTLNANAPTEFPVNFPFQMVESLASTGYIVTLADYPGFGESKDLPHPYLVAEPTVRSLVDLLYAVKEMDAELPDVTVKNEYYLMGYSQGGWATLQLHKALEQDYSSDFNLKGTVCGAGPYNIYLLLQSMVSQETYPEPVYIAYILNAFVEYGQFTNPISDIMNEPYASRVPGLFTGQKNFTQINSQLTTSIPGLLKNDFLTGFATSPKFASVREALNYNSISGWKTNVPLLMVHGSADTQVYSSATENMYTAMIQAGSSISTVKKVIIPGADHSSGLAPAMVMGFWFLNDIKNSR